MARAASPITSPSRPARRDFALATSAGPLAVRREGPLSYSVDMGAPRLGWRDIPLAREAPTRARGRARKISDCRRPPASAWAIRTPSSSCRGIEAFDLAAIGPTLEHDPLFPQRANISLAQLLIADHIRLKVWERGDGPDAAPAARPPAPRGRRRARRPDCSGRALSLPGGDLSSMARLPTITST